MEGSELELAVTNVAHGGISVARHEGRVVFVSDAIPGERVVARVTDAGKAKFWRAETVRVLESSPHRREHVWPEASVDRDPADRAGGAEFGHIELGHQRELKRQVLTDALQRFGGIERDVEVEGLPGADDGTGWRTRVRLHVDSQGRLGPFAARSHRVIPVTSLPLATDALQRSAPLDQEFGGVDHVDVLAPSVGEPRLVVGEQAPSVIRERVGDREFRLADTGFWQVHEHAAATLSDAVAGAVDEALFDPRAANLDLYGGVGLFAAAIGDRFGSTVRITSVEGDPLATDHAAENLAEWVGAQAVTGRIERWLGAHVREASASERARLRSGTVVLDPPRSGAGKQVVAALGDAQPAQIVYVACDPVAFSRDVALLRDRGYDLDSLRAFDLFPNTHHVEALGHFRRAI